MAKRNCESMAAEERVAVMITKIILILLLCVMNMMLCYLAGQRKEPVAAIVWCLSTFLMVLLILLKP